MGHRFVSRFYALAITLGGFSLALFTDCVRHNGPAEAIAFIAGCTCAAFGVLALAVE